MPNITPNTHVQMYFASAFNAIATTPATNQQNVPITTMVTIDRIFDFMKEE